MTTITTHVNQHATYAAAPKAQFFEEEGPADGSGYLLTLEWGLGISSWALDRGGNVLDKHEHSVEVQEGLQRQVGKGKEWPEAVINLHPRRRASQQFQMQATGVESRTWTPFQNICT